MRKLAITIAVLLLSVVGAAKAGEYDRIKHFVNDSFSKSISTGQFNCAYKGKKASKPCTVVIKKEFITHPSFVQWNGKADKAYVIAIKWPDNDISKYTWVDSGEMINLGEKDYGDYHLAGDEVEDDWSRGFVIRLGQNEHVRLW